jgi:hypothetical protein
MGGLNFIRALALHLHEYLDSNGQLSTDSGNLDRSEPWASLHQIEDIDIRCSEGQMDHIFVVIEIGISDFR